MAVTVAAVMRQVRNYFERGYIDNEFVIRGGVLSMADGTPIESPYVAISGSMHSDGVYVLDDGVLRGSERDESFSGRVWLLNPPPDFLALCEQISAFDDKRPPTDIVSESFGSYHYSTSGGGMARTGWKAVFTPMLAPYRKMFTEVMI